MFDKLSAVEAQYERADGGTGRPERAEGSGQVSARIPRRSPKSSRSSSSSASTRGRGGDRQRRGADEGGDPEMRELAQEEHDDLESRTRQLLATS